MKRLHNILLLAAGVILLTTCKNELLTVIEEEVTIAVTPPAVSSIYPENNASGISVSIDSISIEFTKSISPSSVNKTTIMVNDQDGNTVPGTFTVNGQTVSFNPSGSLSYLKTYMITITTGVLDTDGNQVTDEFSWTFTTTFNPDADLVPPSVEDLIINKGASATNSQTLTVDIFADDNAGKDGLKYKLRLEGEDWPAVWSDMGDGGTILDISVDLAVSIDNVQVIEAIVQDIEGNISDISSSSILYESTPPSPVSWTPVGSNVPGDTSVVTVTFNESLSMLSVTTESVYVQDSAGNAADTMENASIILKESNSIPNSLIEISGIRLDQFESYDIIISSGVEDVAGNPIGEDKVYSFSTTSAMDQTPPQVAISIDALISSPPADGMKTVLDNGIAATNWNDLTLAIAASDDFNGVKDMKIWEGTSPEPGSFITYSSVFDIDIDPFSEGSGIKYVYFKVRDWANNVNEGYIQIVLDQELPVISSFTVDEGASYSTSEDGLVKLDMEYSDDIPGGIKMTGVTEMAISNDNFGSGTTWMPVESTVQDWGLTELNGTKTVYIKIRDCLNQESIVSDQSIIWDTEPPEVVIQSSQYLEVNQETTQNASISDNIDSSPNIIWSKVSGPGTVSFSDATAAEPDVFADTDGEYEIMVTVTDDAGFSISETIPFIRDTVKPEDTLSVWVPTFNTDKQPEWSWTAVSGADFYRVSYLSSPDWNDPADYTEIQTESYTAETQLSEGYHTLKVSAWDRAGNKSDTDSSDTTMVDTISPTIYGGGAMFLADSELGYLTLDFTDYVTKDGGFIDYGSDIDSTSILWEEVGGSNIDFTGAETDTPTLSVPSSIVGEGERELFSFKVTVADNAGNTNSENFTLDWDLEPPNPPVVSGLRRTPNATPTYSWNSGGNSGSGVFRYRFVESPPAAWINGEDGTSGYSYTPTSPLAADSNGAGDEYTTGDPQYMHTLEVQEKDLAGNWSSAGSWTIYVDSKYIAPPDVSVQADADGNISPRRTTSVTWTWSSGLNVASGFAKYRYRTSEDGGDNWTDWTTEDPSLATTDESHTLNPSTPPTSGVHDFMIEVEECNDTLIPPAWTGEPKTNTVTVDLQGPEHPLVNGSTRTKDETPTWYWSTDPGSDGVGIYQYKIDSGDWSDPVTQTSYTPSSELDEGSHIFYVQEQDPLGNWSISGEKETTIDITRPVLNYVRIDTDDNSSTTEDYSNSTSVKLYINGVYETGLQMNVYDQVNGWSGWQNYSNWAEIDLTSGEADDKLGQALLRDDVGNYSLYRSDYITLDQTAPANLSLVLNDGVYYTPSKDAKFNASATDNYSSSAEIQVQHAYYDGSSWFTSSWESIGDNRYFDTYFSKVTERKYVYARFRDAAGNVTAGDTPSAGWISDSVYMKLVTMRYAHKGYYNNGDVNVYFYESYSPAEVAYTTRYYIYSTTDPDADPNVSTSGFTSHGYVSDDPEYTYNNMIVSVPTGDVRYFWVRPYNYTLGGYGYFSPTSVIGFSSNVTVIYNDDNSTDTAIAEYTKELLENTYYTGGINYDGNISGTMPPYSVTLLPQDLVENSAYSSIYRIYGDPVIITPYTTFSYSSDAYDNRIRNIITNYHGLIAMGYNGLEFLHRVNTNWSSWSLSGTQPNLLNFYYRYSLGTSTSGKKAATSSAEYTWTSPLSNNYLTANYAQSVINLGLFTANVSRYGLNLGSTTIDDGATYAYDTSSTSYHTVVRQGRFMFFGYYDVPGRNFVPGSNGLKYQYGQPFFINIITKMDNY